MKIEYDEATKTISVGAWKVSEYKTYKKTEGSKQVASHKWAKDVLRANGINIESLRKDTYKETNKAIGDALGYSTATLYQHYKKLSYKVFVAPYSEYLCKLAYRPGSINKEALKLIIKNEEILRQAKEDGLWNIMPFIMYSGKNPQELKKEYKNGWKAATSNSLNKNKLVAKHLQLFRAGNIQETCKVPTTLLKLFNKVHHDHLMYAANNFKGKWKDTKFISKEFHMLWDTERLLRELGKDINTSWSPRRMKEEHDKATHEINARKFSPEIFPVLENISVKYFEHAGYTASLLQSALEIANEGAAMGHCVAGYSNDVRNGNYLVYSICKNGERSSTLGVRINNKTTATSSDGSTILNGIFRYAFSQHYGKYNKNVSCKDEVSIVRLLVNKLNGKGE